MKREEQPALLIIEERKGGPSSQLEVIQKSSSDEISNEDKLKSGHKVL